MSTANLSGNHNTEEDETKGERVGIGFRNRHDGQAEHRFACHDLIRERKGALIRNNGTSKAGSFPNLSQLSRTLQIANDISG